ncbi:30S ribosomal protein S17 [Candidatus Micrarchaeota archaeon]|nr:30S ribosomal protein S17 [Candidatus Micrarchaeota archaeon]
MAEECNDKKCYRHGNVRVRGERLSGKVVSTKGKNTAIIGRDITKKIAKYQRWAKERSRIAVHNPPCINAAVGDIVLIGETRKLSKTKAWTVMEVVQGTSK